MNDSHGSADAPDDSARGGSARYGKAERAGVSEPEARQGGDWVPQPRPGDGPDGRGESGPAEALESRRVTEEAARSGRFPHEGRLRDPGNPLEPEDEVPASE